MSNENRIKLSDGLRLFYREFGEGDDVVLCLPGLTRNSRDFIDLAGHLADRYRVICPDLRGRGLSDRDPDRRRYVPGTYLKDIQTLLEALSLRSVYVIGTSLGGLLGTALAAAHPEQVRALVLNDIGPEIDPAGVGRIMGYAGKPTDLNSWEEAGAHVRSLYGSTLPDKKEDFWIDFARRSYREEDGKIIADSDPGIGENLRSPPLALRVVQFLNRIGLLKRIGGYYIDLWDAFRAVRCPCLVLRGEHSDILAQSTVEQMREAHPQLQSLTVANRGHTPLLDEPEVLTAIDRFLAAAAGE